MNRKLKILFLGEPSSANTMSWIEGLESLGCEVVVASVRDGGADGVHPLGRSWLSPRLRMLTCVGELRRLISVLKPDILLAYRVTSYGYLAARSGFQPFVLAAQNEQINYTPGFSPLRRWMLDRFARGAIDEARLIHAWGGNIKDGLLKFGATTDKIMVLHRGVDMSLFAVHEPGLRPLDAAVPVFVSTRSLAPEYMLDRVIKAFAIINRNMPASRLKIIGDGPEKRKLLSLTAKLELSDAVEFTGRMPFAKVAEALRQSDVYVSIIRTEGVSSSLIEARAAGLIPVVADMPASRAMVEDGVDGVLLDKFSPERVAEGMAAALSSAEIAVKALSRAESTRREYDRRRNLGVFIDRYRHLAGFAPAPGRPVHICHVTTSHGANDSRIFKRECVGLAKLGYRVSIVARDAGGPRRIEGVDIVPVRYILGRLGRKFILPKMAEGKARRLGADIYHFHDPELLPWMCFLAKRHGAKVVWDVHELYTATIGEFHIKRLPFLAKWIAAAFSFLEKICCRSFAGVIAVTEPIRGRYIEMGFECGLIRNVIDLERMPELEGESDPDFLTLIAGGTTNESRCVFELLEAIAIAKSRGVPVRLRLLALFDSPRDELRVMSRIAKLEINDEVFVSPLVSWEDMMANEIPSADVGLVLYAGSGNNFAGLPNRLFEYWACSLPVIATDTPVLNPIVAGNDAGLVVDSSKPEVIAAAMAEYHHDRELRGRHGRNGRLAVERDFNWQNDLKKLDAMYRKILDGMPRLPGEGGVCR